ncbi:MAG: FdrA family protein [Bacillota bacterium]
MAVRVRVLADRYYDSVTLMALSRELEGMAGVVHAVVAMGTETNREALAGVGLLTPEAEAARASDLIIAVSATQEQAAEAAIAGAEGRLQGGAPGAVEGEASQAAAPRSIPAARRLEPEANLAFISVPGAYAAREARLALEQGLHVMLFSDNVPVADEVRLKRMALERSLLLMGPDCGTAILDGVGLGFANAVRRGPIGVVAASGTGAQELSVLVDRMGSGISQLIGVGGRDLSAEVGGLMTLEALRRLQADPQTRVIVLVSKPPAPAVAAGVKAVASEGPKPVVLCLLSGEQAMAIDDAAVEAVRLSGVQTHGLGAPAPLPTIAPGRRWVRGLFSGGTLCAQAEMLLEPVLGEGHTFLDLGDDEYTVGRPHPMIDMGLRTSFIRREAADPETALILLDVVLGYGAHPDPAGALAPAIREAVGSGVLVVASVTGTEQDPQGFSRQMAALQAAGAIPYPTARQAALAVAAAFEGRS